MLSLGSYTGQLPGGKVPTQVHFTVKPDAVTSSITNSLDPGYNQN
jgi:hypothetical protein